MLARLMTALALALAIVSGSALAQSEEEEVATPPPSDVLIEEQETEQVLSADLIGADVLHSEHGTIGTLDSILFDEDDKIVGGVVAVGGFLGFGKKRVALSWDQFEVRDEEQAVYVDVTREELDVAPGFKDQATIRAEEEAEEAQREMEM
ncbi:MAG: PRC-barrel domain-containing protein, partial [Hyphomicrobiales bacterium]